MCNACSTPALTFGRFVNGILSPPPSLVGEGDVKSGRERVRLAPGDLIHPSKVENAPSSPSAPCWAQIVLDRCVLSELPAGFSPFTTV
jgi:hypothetical protein